MSETNEVTQQIIKGMTEAGHFVFRVNNITARHRAGIIYKGIPDIMGIGFGGTPLGIEIKTGNDKQSSYQIEFAGKWRKYGGIYVIASSLKDIEDLL